MPGPECCGKGHVTNDNSVHVREMNLEILPVVGERIVTIGYEPLEDALQEPTGMIASFQTEAVDPHIRLFLFQLPMRYRNEHIDLRPRNGTKPPPDGMRPLLSTIGCFTRIRRYDVKDIHENRY